MSIREILCRKAPVSKWLPAACMVLLLFSACKKSNSGAAAVAAPLRIKTEITIENNVADTITYYYDANWRQIRSSAASQHITDVFISDTLINTVSYLGRAYPYSSSLYRISAQGLASSRASSSYDGVNYHDYYSIFTYNAAKQLSKDVETDTPVGADSLNLHYYYSTNLDSMIQLLNKAVLLAKESYTYYTDKPNTLSNDAYGLGWLGISSQNPVKKTTDLLFGYGKDYTYEYDTKNRITKRTMVVHTRFGDATAVSLFTYY